MKDIIPNDEYRKKIEAGLYSGEKWLGPNGVFSELLQSIVNAALDGEMDEHLGETKSAESPNRRNGKILKKVQSEAGPLQIQSPRDRNGTFEPVIVQKRKKELKGGLEDIIISLYAKGNSVEDIHQLLYKIYGVEYSTSAISLITDRIMPKVLEWQQRPLEGCYMIVYLDGIHYRVKQDGAFVDKCVYSVYSIDVEGNRDVLGLYLSDAESASQWGLILEDLKRRGVEDIMFVCIDGLKGFKQAIEQVFPRAIVQRCIVHKIRNSVRFVPDKDRKALCRDLRTVYNSATREQAKIALESFRVTWGKMGEKIAQSWEEDWEEIMAYMDFSGAIRKMIYTTNPVEALHRILRKVTKSKGAWISEGALTKQIYLTLIESEKSWKRKAFNHITLQSEMEEKFGERYIRWLAK
ncbi:MAG: IS256 family transposase [Saprospiraceae bacterium]